MKWGTWCGCGHLIRHCHNPLHVCYLKMRIIAAPAPFCHRPGHVINKSKHSSDYNSYKLPNRALEACLYTFSDIPARQAGQSWFEFIWSIADVSSQQSNFGSKNLIWQRPPKLCRTALVQVNLFTFLRIKVCLPSTEHVCCKTVF